ncbi:MAG: TonB-dependent receptor [Acidobacteriota bacterium]|nr:TonB-dependent receptor [Acidobacteriota bacterium]
MRAKNSRNQNTHVATNSFDNYSGKIISICCLLIFFTAFVLPIKAQSNVTGGLQGFIYIDDQKTPARRARVKIISSDTKIPLGTAETNDQGYFSRPDIPPGSLDIEITLDNYVTKKLTYDRFSLGIFNDFLPPQVLEKVSNVAVNTNPNSSATPTNVSALTADNPLGIALETQRGGSFNDSEVRTLPLGGQTLVRTFDELALLLPGVASAPEPIGNNVGPGIGPGVGTSGQFSVNGLSSRANNFMIDGSDNNDEDIGVRRQGFFSLIPQPIESIQEFQIITLLAPAQYGRNLGGQVNAVSKSGTSNIRGTLYAFFNSDRLNARNFFDFKGDTSPLALTAGGKPVTINNAQAFVQNPAGNKDSLTLLQGGGVLSGPIVPERTFFFAAAEGQLLNAVRESHFAVPTVEQRGFLGSGASGINLSASGSQTTILRPTTESGNLIFSLFPFPNDPNGVYGRNTLTQVLPADARGKVISGRVDHYFSLFGARTQTLTARYNYTDDSRDLPVTGGAIFSSLKSQVRTDNFSTYLTGELTDNLSNLLRFSWGRTRLRFKEIRDNSFLLPTSASFGDPAQSRFLLNARLLNNTTLPNSSAVSYSASAVEPNTEQRLGAVGQVIIGGFSPVGVDVFNFPQQRVNNTFQIADTVRSNAVKNHNLAFGTDIRRTFLDSDLPRNSRPLITFYGAPNFAGNSIPVTRTTFLAPGNTACGQPGTVGNALGCSTIASAGSLQGLGSFISPLDLAAVGAPTGFFQSLVEPGKDARINLGYYQYNFFAQDDWRVRYNLSISYGLRYEYNTPPKEADEKIEGIFRQPLPKVAVPDLTTVGNPIIVPDIISGLNQFIDGRSGIYDADRNNFAPRFGLAYSPTDSTVIRGGYGTYYDQILGSVVSQSRNVFPTFTTVNFGGGLPCYLFSIANGVCPVTLSPNNNGFVFNLLTPTANPTARGVRAGTLNTLDSNDIRGAFGFLHLAKNGNGSPFGATLPARKLDTPMSHQYHAGIEQKLFKRDMFLSVSYVGTTGRNLLRFTTPNLGSNYIVRINELSILTAPSTVSGYESSVPTLRGFTFDPSANGLGRGRPTANVGNINQFETTGRSQYHSLQFQLRGGFKSSNQALQYQVNYTLGQVKDDVSDVFDLAGSSALPQNSLNFAGEYASSNFDVRHKVAYSLIYDLPQLKNENQFVRGVLGGWQIAGSGRIQTGQPFTVNSIFDVNLDGNLTDRLNNTSFISENGGNNAQVLVNSSGSNVQLQSMLAAVGSDGSIGRNSFRGRSLLNLDLSFNKRFSITERQNLQFRVDVFNFINRANFAIPVHFLEAPSFGQAVDTVTPGRRVQFALKYLF